MNYSDWFADPSFSKDVMSIVFFAIMAVITLWAAKHGWKQAMLLAGTVIGSLAIVRSAVDQPTDDFPRLVDKLLDQWKPGDWDVEIAAKAPKLIDFAGKLAEEIEKRGGQSPAKP